MVSSMGALIRQTRQWLLTEQRAVKVFLVLALSIDAALALIHAVVMIGWDAPDMWRIDMDGSYGEAYQYLKYIWLLILLIGYARQTRTWPMLGWALLVVYFLIDDALLIHERVGFWYASQEWAFSLGPISAQTIGELSISGIVGLILLAPLVVGYVRGDLRTKWIFRVLVALFATLLIFAVIVDTLHSFFVSIKPLDRSLGFIEDLGEMVVLTVIVAFAFRLNVSGGRPGFVDELALAPALLNRTNT